MSGEENFGRFTSWLYYLFAIPLMRPVYAFVADDVMRSGAKRVLDVGTGPAQVPIMLSSMSRKLEIYAVDPSDYMLSIASRRSGGLGIRLGSGYSLHIPFRTKFDLIISSISFHHWAHKKESLRYLSGFLRRSGEIRIYEFRKMKHLIIQESHSMGEDEFRRIAEGTGLRVKSIIERKGILRASYVKS